MNTVAATERTCMCKRANLVAAAHRQIATHCHSAYTLEQLADDLDIAPRTLQRALGTGGTTFANLLQDVRAQRAAELLARGAPVAEVSRACGYRSFSHFSAVAFPTWFAATPTRLCEFLELARGIRAIVASKDDLRGDDRAQARLELHLSKSELIGALQRMQPRGREAFMAAARQMPLYPDAHRHTAVRTAVVLPSR